MFGDLSGTYDVILAGTGPSEALISGAMAHAGKKLIHLDAASEYGGCRKTKGILDFIQFLKDNGKITVDQISEMEKKPRNGEYSIDMLPLTVFARDDLIKVIKDSGSIDSVYFYLVDGMYFRGKTNWRAIPCSKSAVFKDRQISLRTKRMLMKFIAFFFPEADYGHEIATDEVREMVEKYQDKPFHSLMEAFDFDKDMSNAFEYFVALAPGPVLTRDAVKQIRSFCNSIGVYGATPLLTFGYGAADLPQVFARYSAVYQGAFVLNHGPKNIRKDEDGFVVVDVDEIGEIKSKTVIVAPDQIFGADAPKRLIAYREVVLMKVPMFSEDRAVAVIPPGLMNNEKPVYVTQFDWGCRVCPKEQFLIHVCSMCPVEAITTELLDGISPENILLRGSFVLEEPTGDAPDGVIVVPSPTVDDLSMGTNFFAHQARSILESCDQEVPFYPEPTEVEIEVDEPQPVQSEASKPEEVKPEEAKAEETKTEESKPEEAKAEEPKE